MAEDIDGEPCRLGRGHKSDSYIFAVQNNRIPLELDPPPRTDIVRGTELYICRKRGVLDYDDVELYRADPFWRRLRLSLFIAFWLTWILLFLSAICIIIVSPTCNPAEAGKWWTTALIYELWTSSFQDSNADGVGDLAGVKARLDDMRRIGVNVVFPRQFLHTDATGMGVLNFVRVHDAIGTLEDAEALIEAAHEKGLRVIIDFPLVVTSSAHHWFQRSAEAFLPENAKFSAFYYWKRGVRASEFVSEYKNTSIFYFHFRNRPDLPILNWNSVLVSQAIKKALSFWIDKNVDGIHFSFIDYLHRSFDGFQPEWDVIVKFLRGIRNHVQNHSRQSNVTGGKEIFIIASPGDLKEEEKRRLSAESAFSGIMNAEMSRIALRNRICYENEATVAGCVNEILSDLLRFYSNSRVSDSNNRFRTTKNEITAENTTVSSRPSSLVSAGDTDGVWPVWTFANSFTSRMASRLRSRRHAELLMMLELCLPGTPVVYYGEEIGLGDCCGAEEKIFHGRGHMVWDDSADFQDKKREESTFSVDVNFKSQLADYNSQLWTFRRLTRARRYRKAFGAAGGAQIGALTRNAFALCRFVTSENRNLTRYGEVIVVAVNFGMSAVDLPLLDLPPFKVPAKRDNPNLQRPAEILALNSHNEHYSVHERLDISTGRIRLGANEGVVFRLMG